MKSKFSLGYNFKHIINFTLLYCMKKKWSEMKVAPESIYLSLCVEEWLRFQDCVLIWEYYS